MNTLSDEDSITRVFLLVMERERLLAELEKIDGELVNIAKQGTDAKKELLPPRGRGRPKTWELEDVERVHAAIKEFQETHRIPTWGAATYQWLIASISGIDQDQIAKWADNISKNHVPKDLKPKNF